MMNEMIDQLSKIMPPIFPASRLDELTGNAVRWSTLQNRRGKNCGKNNQIPPSECFLYDGARKVLIVRDVFLKWWIGTLQTVNKPQPTDENENKDI